MKAAVKAIRTHLASNRLTNEQLAEEFGDWGVEKISSKTGISVRGIAGEDECASDLGVAAANKLFDDGVCSPDDIDFLLLCTQSPDYFLPTTACVMQTRLGLPTSCGALDYNLGCSGYIYGLALAKGLIETGQSANVLLVTADTYQKYIHPSDRSVRTIFSDGAAATLISGMKRADDAIGPFVFGTDGSGAQKLIVPAGGHRERCDSRTSIPVEVAPGVWRSRENLYMDGPDVFSFTLDSVPPLIGDILKKCAITVDDVDYFVFHQANKFMLEHLRRKSGIPREKFCLNLESYGNTVSSTIPMALEIAAAEGDIEPGDSVLLAGFGVGYSWGATMIRIV